MAIKIEKVESDTVADVMGTLSLIHRGNFMINCGRKMQELTDAIKETGKKGRIVISLDVAPSGLKHGRVSTVEIRPDVSIVKPKHDQGKVTFFVTEDNKLVREDPSQAEMDFGPEGAQA